jgi:hypothetical protein
LPLGVPWNISVEFSQPPARGDWQAKVRVTRQHPGDEDPRTVWHTEIAISSLSGNRARFTLQLPVELPNTVDGSREESIGCELRVTGPHGEWSFNLATREANERELAAHPVSVATKEAAGAEASVATVEQRRRVRVIFIATNLIGMVALGVWLTSTGFSIPLNLGPSYSVPHQLPPFSLRISSWRDNRWGVQAELEGTAQVADRALELKDARLRLRGFLRCAKQKQCQLASASLLLARDRDDHFETLAESEPVPLDVRLRAHEIADVSPVSFRLDLPKNIARDDVYLKLELRTVDGATMYINSKKLLLQRMFAAREGAVDPCTQVKRMDDAIRSGCPAQSALPPPPSLDTALILALRLEANDWIPALIDAGAHPDARDPDNPQLTALALAAEFDEVELMDLLLARGADPSMTATNDLGQTVTPLNRALRRDSARAVSKLLATGARPHPPNAMGWSTIHVAAYEGAAMSLPALVAAGADVNQRSIARAQNQTPLMTAIQHANGATIRKLIELGADPRLRDANGNDSCDWAKRFKKDRQIVALVCAETNNQI